MALVDSLLKLVVRRFATQTSRFYLAISCGFIIVAAGTLIVGTDAKRGIAGTIWGAMEVPDGGGFASEPRAAAPEPSPQYADSRHRKRARLAREERRNRRKVDPTLVAHAGDDDGYRGHLAGRSLCVRLCDGFVFPVGDYHGDGDRSAHEATCQAECPGARTALFVVPQGSDSISDASAVGSGKNYSELPGAFHYTTYLDATCSCHPSSGNRMKSLLHDFTLRRGDAVMTSRGLQVFHGGSSYPFNRKDFVALSKSRDIRKGDRAHLKAIERASLPTPDDNVAFVAPSEPTPTADARPEPPRERQAQN